MLSTCPQAYSGTCAPGSSGRLEPHANGRAVSDALRSALDRAAGLLRGRYGCEREVHPGLKRGPQRYKYHCLCGVRGMGETGAAEKDRPHDNPATSPVALGPSGGVGGPEMHYAHVLLGSLEAFLYRR